MRSRRAFTLIELLVVVVVLGILVLLAVSSLGGCQAKDPLTGKKFNDITTTATYRCVKTYTMTSGGSGDSSASTSNRVDLVPVDRWGDDVTTPQTLTVDDDWWLGIANSGELYAQFEPQAFYRVTSIGFRRVSEWAPLFPKVKSVERIQLEPAGEIEFP